MAWRYTKYYLRTKESTDPRTFMPSLHAMASEANGFLDRDNLTPVYALSSGKIAAKACNSLGIKSFTGGTTGLDNTNVGQWVTISSLTESISCVDGVVEVDAWVQAEVQGLFGIDSTTSDFTEYQLLIDGTVVASTGWISSTRIYRCHHLVGAKAVRAGTVVLSFRARGYHRNPARIEYVEQGRFVSSMTDSERYTYGQMTLSNDILFTSGALVWRHMKR